MENTKNVIYTFTSIDEPLLENIKDESAKCSELFTNLIFEDDKNKINCNLEYINKKKLEKNLIQTKLSEKTLKK